MSATRSQVVLYSIEALLHHHINISTWILQDHRKQTELICLNRADQTGRSGSGNEQGYKYGRVNIPYISLD